HNRKFRLPTSKTFERSPQTADECVDTVEMRDSAGGGIPDYNARPINSRNDLSLAVRVCYKQFRFTFGFLVGILERLTHIDFVFQGNSASVAGDILGADVVETAAGNAFDDTENVPRTAHVHLKNFVAILRQERKRCRAVPDFIS